MTPAEIIAAAREIVEWRDNGEKPLVVSNSIQQFGLMFARELLRLHDDAEALRAERDQLRREVESLNEMIRQYGFGQGEINGWASEHQELKAELAEAKAALAKKHQRIEELGAKVCQMRSFMRNILEGKYTSSQLIEAAKIALGGVQVESNP